MHGRIKVKTTEEQAEAKRKEQQEKLKVYLKTTSKIFNKREKSEHDEEALQLTGAILEHNPDFYTLWNYRREVLLALKPDKDTKEIKDIANTELNLTQHCLLKNPKSYAAWHHRYWVMKFNPEADWKKELKLCGYFLSQDERNFHCWDYRRLVSKKCEVSPDEELDFSTDLINSNFSNYSAWHYRSTLLPLVYPGPTKDSLPEDVLQNELELVHNAAFTDPDDQSAWFYHRWLLGRSKVPLQILNVTVLKHQNKVAVLLSKQEKVHSDTLKLSVDGNYIDIEWKTISSYFPASSIWFCDLSEDTNIADINSVTVELIKEDLQCSLSCSKGDNFSAWSKTERNDVFRSELSSVTKEVLESELEMCQQLIELEPNSKWTLFTSVLLMRALNDIKFQEKTREYMKSLKEIDPSRKNYYNDFESKIVIEDYIESLPLHAKEVNLANKHLSSLHHCDQFILIQTMDLSSNQLKSVFPLCHLVSVKKLILDNNLLTNFTGLEHLQSLKFLSAKKNLIQNASCLEALTNCENLEELYINDNPLLTDFSLHKNVRLLEKIPALKIT